MRAEPSASLAWTAGLVAVGLGAAAVRIGAARPLMLAALVLAGFANAKLSSDRAAAPILAEPYRGAVIGRYVGLDRSQSNRPRILLDQVHLPGINRALTPDRVRIVLPSEPRAGVLQPGAALMLRANLTPPPSPVEPGGFDFRRHAWFLSLGAIGYSADPVMRAPDPVPGGAQVALFRLRMHLAQVIRANMPAETGPFAAAILTGDRSAIDPDDLVALRASNLAHLLAISGLHMGLLAGFVFAVVRYGLALAPGVALRFPTKKIAVGAALAAGTAYLAISGGAVATQRAFVMAAVVLVAVLFDRPALTLRAVAVAALIVMVIRPYSVLGPGFQMSFAATVGLIATYEALKRQEWWRALDRGGWRLAKIPLGLVITSTVAGAATAPISAFHFNQIAQYGLLANVLAVPAMGFLVMPSAVLTLVLTPLGAGWLGFALMDLGIAHILTVAERVAALEGALIPVASGPGWVLAVIAAGGVAAAVIRGPVRLAGAAMIAVALVGWNLSERPLVLVSPGGEMVGVLGEDGRMLSKGRGSGFVARVWLENDGDQADQALAHGRWQTGKGVEIAIGDNPDGKSARSRCVEGIVLLAPRLAEAPAGDCMFLGRKQLKDTGALAFVANREMPLTAREVSGARPWVPGARDGVDQ